MALAVVTVCLDQTVFKMQEGSFQLRTFSDLSASRFRPSNPRFGGPHEQLWTFQAKMGALSIAETIELEGFLARMAGRNWAFTAYDSWRTDNGRGVGGGYAPSNDEIKFTDATSTALSFCSDFKLREGATSALVHTAAASGATGIRIKNLPTSLEGQSIVKLGDQIGIGTHGEMNLHMAMNNAVCDSNGEAYLQFLPALWKPVVVGDFVNFRNPTARFVFAERDRLAVERNRDNFGHITLNAIEVPYQAANP